jgi:methyl-accepting chemotaxis protein
MRVTHWVAILGLFLNSFLFTENKISATRQLFIALVVVFHDRDEKKWGVNTLRETGDYLKNFEEKVLNKK